MFCAQNARIVDTCGKKKKTAALSGRRFTTTLNAVSYLNA
jgi:hypothetical protein